MFIGNSFFDPDDTFERIRVRLCSKKELLDTVCLPCLERQVRSLIAKLVLKNPKKRRSALRASEHATFKSALSTTMKKEAAETVATKSKSSVIKTEW